MAGPLKRILIADDHDVVRRGVRALLEDQPDMQVVAEAADGRAALAAALSTEPHIAVIDYAMPGLNGGELTVALKRELPRIEVLVLTRHEEERLLLDLIRAGARAIVLKSDASEQLVQAVRQLWLHRPFLAGAAEPLLAQILDNPDYDRSSITGREREVVQLIAEGHTNKEMARLLDISVKTVETHRTAAMKRLRVRSTAALVRYAIRNGIAVA